MAMELNYEEHGSGQPIILLHAFPLSHSMWKPQIEPITAKNWRVITPDFPGFGDSAAPAEILDIEKVAEAVAHLLSKLGIEKAVIGGLSMGGYVALNFARLFPEKIKALILADTNAVSDTEEKRQSRYKLIGKIKDEGSQILIEEMLPNMISEATKQNNSDLVNDLKEIFKKVDPNGAEAALLGMAKRKDHNDFLNSINKPTLLIFGKDDKITNLDAAESLNQNITGSKLVTITKAGHLSNLEQPEVFNNAVINFLHSLS